MNFAKYINVASRIKEDDADTKAAYWLGILDGVITVIIIGTVLWSVHYA